MSNGGIHNPNPCPQCGGPQPSHVPDCPNGG